MSNYNNLSKDELLKLVEKQEAELKTKKYGLVWDSEKEPEQVVLDCENNIPILQRVKEKEIKTDDSDDNILIEGDNYHALTCLNYTHKGKVDAVYIDPPYNTGNNDFIYNDKFVEKEDGYRHSKWINFMEKRLRLAKNLLAENGVIFISIDDKENYSLKMLCDSIFDEKNFIANLIWKSKSGGANDSKYFAVDHEYILVYSNNAMKCPVFIDSFATVTTSYNRQDEKGVYALDRLDKQSIRYSESLDYQIKDLNGNSYFPAHKDKNNPNATWRWSKKTVAERFDELVFENGFVYTKNYKSDDIIARSLLLEDRFGRTRTGKTELFEMFQKNVFNNPKPSKLILNLCRFVQDQNITILDFFAGSGTTGHAVLELNKQDGGNRKFILCTNNENKICEEVTYPRIHNVIKGYKFKGKDKTTLFEQKLTFSQLKNIDSIVDELNKTIEENTPKFDEIEKKFEDNTIKITGIKNIDSFKDGLNGNLQYFKTDLIPVERIDNINDEQRKELTKKAGQMIAIKENTFEEIETNEWYQIFENKDKNRKTTIYFREDESHFDELINKVGKTKAIVYLFSYEEDIKKDLFHIPENIKLEAIPEPIIKLYQKINLTLKKN